MSIEAHEKRILYNLKNHPAIRELPEFVDVNICLGGEFKTNKGISEYSGGTVFHKYCAWLKKLDVVWLRAEVEEAMRFTYNGSIASNFSVWFKVKGEDDKYVTKLIESSEDIEALVGSRDMYERVTIYVEEFWDGSEGRKKDLKEKGKAPLRPKVKSEKGVGQPKPLKIGLSPTRKSPRFNFGPDVVILPPNHPDIPFIESQSTLKKSSKPNIPICPRNQKTPTKTGSNSQKAPETPPPPCQNAELPLSKPQLTRSSPRFKQVARKKVYGAGGSPKTGLKKAHSVKKGQKKDEIVDEGCEESSESDFSDLDVDFDPEEEDFKNKEKEQGDEYVHFNPKEITKAVVDAFKKNKASSKHGEPDVETEVGVVQEPTYDSDELHSLHGLSTGGSKNKLKQAQCSTLNQVL